MCSLHLMIFSLFLTDFLVGTKPLLCSYKGQWHTPAFFDQVAPGSDLAFDLITIGQSDFRKLNYSFSLWPLLNLNPKELNPGSAWQPPLSSANPNTYSLLGTYDLGRDLFSACVVGLQRSLQLALLAILIACFLGLILGALTAFQTVRYRSLSMLSLALITIATGILLIFILISIDQLAFELDKFLFLTVICAGLMAIARYFWHRRPFLSFSSDKLSLGYIELMKSIPSLLMLLLLVQLFIHPNVWALAVIIGFIYTPVLMRYSRNFCFQISSTAHIDAQITIGAPALRIFLKHVLPSVFIQLAPVLAFGVANIILLEASLSFLGLGLAADEISLGKIMEAARLEPGAWWVVLFPGLLVFWLLYSFNALGDCLSRNKTQDDMEF